MTKHLYEGNCDPLNHFDSLPIRVRSCITVALCLACQCVRWNNMKGYHAITGKSQIQACKYTTNITLYTAAQGYDLTLHLLRTTECIQLWHIQAKDKSPYSYQCQVMAFIHCPAGEWREKYTMLPYSPGG